MHLRFIAFYRKIFFFLTAICFSIVTCIVYHCNTNLPGYTQLKQYHPPLVTRVYSKDGKLIEEYAKEHRMFVPIDAIPQSLIQAFVSAEDKNFYKHFGIDIFSIIRAGIKNILHILSGNRIEGGSTITQQVVKNFLLTSERSVQRKIKEAILSYRISHSFTKDEILELYLNQIYLGKGTYGVASAALNYFNKSVEELNINESAILASLPKAPSKFDPKKNYDIAFERKNYVLERMYNNGYITKIQKKEAIKMPIRLVECNKIQTINASYYADKVRDEVISIFGEEYFYTAGLTIMTCLDSKMQESVVDALRFGIRRYDMMRGYRGPLLRNISIDNWHDELNLIKDPPGIQHYQLAIVLSVQDKKAKIGLKNKKVFDITLHDIVWKDNNLLDKRQCIQVGDIIIVEKISENFQLRQIPNVNGAMLVIQNKTGRVLAAEGGYDHTVSKFDRTTQARRQPGSLIKPFIYLSALENDVQPNSIFEDAEINIEQGPNRPIWKPENYEKNFLGRMTLRKGFEKSRNTVTVRVGQFVGIPKIAEIIKRFGINDNPLKVQSIVLGTLETTLTRMTIAYGIIASGGKKIEPHYIELIKDRRGNVIYKRDYTEHLRYNSYEHEKENNTILNPPEVSVKQKKIITDEASNYQITSLMIGVMQRGTGRSARHIKQIVAGKTGTTNKAKDAWFIGFTPEIVVGTYIGYDTPQTLGSNQSGASIALPIFIHFMKNVSDNMPLLNFNVPCSITLKPIDYETGIISMKKGFVLESFKNNSFNQINQDNDDSFFKIQEDDPSQEIY